ncbi:hypothetical protein HPB52_018279 [Rhipicephalus sanguineus]|uniref:Uncharacterized protein n=1 Tax=Rhipicephalus sanguineus TaxID=34632 RepID=A0A9D4TB56_RHISA|nr:hypothetical protein HPB52_018279 [Rhipicephalus sanguineus]
MADPVTQVVGRIGHMEPFDDSSSDWTSYDERLTSFLHFDKVPEADKVHEFLSLIGAKTYALLKSLTAPDLPSSKSNDTLMKLLGDHLAPKPSVIADVSKGEENKDTFWEFSDTTSETPTAAPAATEAALPDPPWQKPRLLRLKNTLAKSPDCRFWRFRYASPELGHPVLYTTKQVVHPASSVTDKRGLGK